MEKGCWASTSTTSRTANGDQSTGRVLTPFTGIIVNGKEAIQHRQSI